MTELNTNKAPAKRNKPVAVKYHLGLEGLDNPDSIECVMSNFKGILVADYTFLDKTLWLTFSADTRSERVFAAKMLFLRGDISGFCFQTKYASNRTITTAAVKTSSNGRRYQLAYPSRWWSEQLWIDPEVKAA